MESVISPADQVRLNFPKEYPAEMRSGAKAMPPNSVVEPCTHPGRLKSNQTKKHPAIKAQIIGSPKKTTNRRPFGVKTAAMINVQKVLTAKKN